MPALPATAPQASRNGAALRGAAAARALADLLAGRFSSLSPKHKIVAQFVVDNPQFSSMATTRQLAEKVGVDAATVTRFAKSLGFAGFLQFRRELRGTYLGMLQPTELMERQQPVSGDVYRVMILRDLQNLQELLRTLDVAGLNRAASMLARARRIVAVSSGSYAAAAVVLAQLSMALGIEVEVETRGRVAWVPRLAALSARDVVVGVSFWRCDPEVVAAVRWAAARGVKTLAITDSSLSPLAEVAGHRIIVPTEGMLFFQSVTASLSIVYGLVAAMWMRLPPSRRGIYDRIRTAFDDLHVFG